MLNPEIDLSGKTAVVTGASRGIGEAAVRRLAAAQANVVLLARSAAEIEQIAAELGNKALAIHCDVSNWSVVEAAFAQCHANFGAIDILVNNAGLIDPVARMEDADPIAWANVVDVNLKGPFFAIRAALPMMPRPGGVIINISSGAATNALEGWSHYCSTKAGLLSLTKCVHKELAEQGVRCVGLSPGTVATDMQKVIASSQINPVSQMDWSQHIPPAIVGDAIAWLCTAAARDFDGGDFSLKTEKERRAMGWIKDAALS